MSDFFVASLPLPKDHWLYEPADNTVPLKTLSEFVTPNTYPDLKQAITAAAKRAIKAATLNGKEQNFDPDALVQNLVIQMLGYRLDMHAIAQVL